jgi:hypothetical protein
VVAALQVIARDAEVIRPFANLGVDSSVRSSMRRSRTVLPDRSGATLERVRNLQIFRTFHAKTFALG